MFNSAQAHFTEANNPHAKYIWTNINASLRGVVDKTMSGLEPLRVTERNAKPTIANPKAPNSFNPLANKQTTTNMGMRQPIRWYLMNLLLFTSLQTDLMLGKPIQVLWWK